MSIDIDKLDVADEVKDSLRNELSQFQSSFEAEKNAMKAKMQELLDESKAYKAKMNEALESKSAAELEAMKKDGDIKGIEERLQSEYQSKFSLLEEKLQAKDQLILNTKKDEYKAQLIALANNENNAQLLSTILDNSLSANYSEDGNVAVSFRPLGSDNAMSDVKEMKSFLQDSEVFKSLVASKVGTGSGATHTSGTTAHATTNKRSNIKNKYNLKD